MYYNKLANDHKTINEIVQLLFKDGILEMSDEYDENLIEKAINRLVIEHNKKITTLGNTISMSLFHEGGNRRTGRTTKLVDEYINKILLGEMVVCYDHHMYVDNELNDQAYNLVIDRLNREFNISIDKLRTVKNELTINIIQ